MTNDDFDTTPMHMDSPGVAAKKARLRNPQTKNTAKAPTFKGDLEKTQDLEQDGQHSKLAGFFQSLALKRSSSK